LLHLEYLITSLYVLTSPLQVSIHTIIPDEVKLYLLARESVVSILVVVSLSISEYYSEDKEQT
jgi:hypothetical protein